MGEVDSLVDQVQALIEFAAWCCASEGNLAKTISGKLAAVQYFHRVDAHMELPTASPLINRELKGIARLHVIAGTPRRVRLPVSWDVLLGGQDLVPSCGPGGRILWLCLALGYFFVARSDEIFASSAGGIHPVHCLQRGDVTFYAGNRRLPRLQWHKATCVHVKFRGHKGDQTEQGSTIIRVRDVARGRRSEIGAGGGAVALMVELMSCHLSLPESAPLCSYRCDRSSAVKVWGYTRALRALRQIVEKAGGNPKEVALHSLRIGAATTLASGGEVPDRIIQRETYKTCTRNNMEDSGLVSLKIAQAGKILQNRQLGKKGKKPQNSSL